MKIFTLVILAIFASSPAFAESGSSFEVLLGTADQDTSISGIGGTSGDDMSIGIRGAFALNDDFAFELTYQDYGETDDTYIDEWGDTISDKTSSTALNLGIQGIMPSGSNFSLIGRIGFALWDYEVKETDSAFPGVTFNASDDGNDLYYGIGMQYTANNQFIIGAEYTITEMDVTLFGISVDHEVSNFSLSFGYSY